MGKLRFVQMAGVGGSKRAEAVGQELSLGDLVQLKGDLAPGQVFEVGFVREGNAKLQDPKTHERISQGYASNWIPLANLERVSGSRYAKANKNHAASEPSAETKRKIASMGLFRVAGNVYECPSTQDFWQVTGGGKIVRLSGDEVDNGESIAAAPTDKPMEFLSSILDDLSF